MHRFFGAKKPAGPTAAEACQKLRDTQEILTKKIEYLEKKIDSETNTARQMGKKNKRMAIAALRRKKQYEKQLQTLDGTLTTVEMQLQSLENTSTNMELVSALQVANNVMKATNKSMNVDSIHDVLDDLQEQKDLAKEVADAISQPLDHDLDMDDLEAELEMLEQEELENELVSVPGVSRVDDLGLSSLPETASLPALHETPTTPAKAAASAENELDDLLQWAD